MIEQRPSIEEAQFEEWFQRYRSERWKLSRPERAHRPPSDVFMMGLRADMLTGWLARASLKT